MLPPEFGTTSDLENQTINASLFVTRLSIALTAYCETLRTTDWDSDKWHNVVQKMNALCDNCRRDHTA